MSATLVRQFAGCLAFVPTDGGGRVSIEMRAQLVFIATLSVSGVVIR